MRGYMVVTALHTTAPAHENTVSNLFFRLKILHCSHSRNPIHDLHIAEKQ